MKISLEELIIKREETLKLLIEKEESLSRSNIIKYSNLTTHDLNKVYQVINEGDSFYNEFYIVIKRIIELTPKIQKDIQLSKNGELEIYRKLNFNIYLNNEEKTIKFEKLLKKYKNIQNIIDFEKLVEEYNSLRISNIKNLEKLLDEGEIALKTLIQNEITINRKNIMNYCNLEYLTLNRIYKYLVKEDNPYHNGFYIIDKFMDLNIEYIEEYIQKTKNTGIKEVPNISYKTFVQNEEKLEQIKDLMNKFKDNEKVIKFNNLIEEYNSLYNYNCLVCGAKSPKLDFERNICFECYEKSGKNQYYKVKCSKCSDLKPIKDYPKDEKLKWGVKLFMCKDCDNEHYLELRRGNAYRYSLTEKGRENSKSNVKKLMERILCNPMILNNYKNSKIKIRDFEELNLMNVINKNERFKRYFNEDMTLEDFFTTKKDLNLAFDHIIPKTYANQIYNQFGVFKELIDLKGKKELKNRISKILNNEINIQLLTNEENNAKHNNINKKDYWLKEDIRIKIQRIIIELYMELKKEEEK